MDDRNEVNATGMTLAECKHALDKAREAYRVSVLAHLNAERDFPDYEARRRMLSLQDLYSRMVNDARACGMVVKSGAAA